MSTQEARYALVDDRCLYVAGPVGRHRPGLDGLPLTGELAPLLALAVVAVVATLLYLALFGWDWPGPGAGGDGWPAYRGWEVMP